MQSSLADVSFRFNEDVTLRWRELGNQVLFFEEQSAQTHVLDGISAELLKRIYVSEVYRSALIEVVGNFDSSYKDEVAAEFVDTSIALFRKLGLLALSEYQNLDNKFETSRFE